MKNFNEPHEKAIENRPTQDIAARPSLASEGNLAAFKRADAPEIEGGQTMTAKREVEFRPRWNDIQANFVDEPRKAVEDAHQLVATAVKQIADDFQEECTHLQQQWTRGGDVSTEDLRISLRQYRTFLDRLMSI
jgi:hypothetical protein